jgi:glycerophosphoryl diester phosphodiesterase
MRRMTVRNIALPALVAALCMATAAESAASGTDWMKLRTMNITHQGGEDEAPSATMYAFARSVRLGADMLEVDIHTTADGHVVVMHDGKVDRTTEGTGSVYDMTLAEVQALDAAHDFVPGIGTTTEEPESSYAFRGVRTGERPPPRGFTPEAFRIPTLAEVMRRYPRMPINIEIKGASDEDVQSFLDNAESLAETLTRIGRTDGIIVASFNDAAIARFHELMPEVDLAPSITETATFKFAGVPPGPGKVAFQVPITFGGLQVTDAAFVEKAHAQGLAVHVWLSNDPENDETYNQLLDWNVDAVMPAAPAAFERVLCARDISRQPRPAGLPGRHCNHDRVSIACDVTPTGLGRMDARGRVRVRLRRRDDFAGGCAGLLSLRAGGKRRTARFDFGRLRPSEGGPRTRVIGVRVPKGVASAGRATLETRAYQAYGHTARFRLRGAR